jgi:hypothetical protein
MPELRREEKPVDTGISTASLAHADEPSPERDEAKESEQHVEKRAAMNRNDARLNPPAETEERAALFSPEESKDLYARWDAIQVGFVDEPRQAVERADSLVAGAMKRLAEEFAQERARLEGQWDRGDNVSTEDLRIALRRYRAFFGRLLSA